ncbi:MAG: thymidylate kinase [Candidatus Brocadiia bacterium]
MNAKNSFPGRLIAVEGLDGSGKSTQIYLLHQWLKGMKRKVFFSEWNSSTLVKEATRRGKKGQLLTPTTFSLIHATDFADRYERQIQPMLEGGYIVLCDRYMFTSFARDGVRGCEKSWLRDLYSFAAVPDITLYFRLPSSIALGRILEGRPTLKYFEAGMDLGLSSDLTTSFSMFSERIMAQYEGMAQEFGFVSIDATRLIHEQQEIVRNVVSTRIELSRFARR